MTAASVGLVVTSGSPPSWLGAEEEAGAEGRGRGSKQQEQAEHCTVVRSNGLAGSCFRAAGNHLRCKHLVRCCSPNTNPKPRPVQGYAEDPRESRTTSCLVSSAQQHDKNTSATRHALQHGDAPHRWGRKSIGTPVHRYAPKTAKMKKKKKTHRRDEHSGGAVERNAFKQQLQGRRMGGGREGCGWWTKIRSISGQ